MTVRNLRHLFEPQTIAVVGASNRPQSVGRVVMQNLLQGGFGGPILPVNPKYHSVTGVLCYPHIDELPETPDLAVICTPPPSVPEIVASLGARGTRAVIVVTAGLSRERDALLRAAQPHLLRILGPNCLGLIVPHVGLNASFAHVSAPPGQIAFVSQSGAFCTAILDWARARQIGFSHFISLGEMADVDFGDVLDYLGGEPRTRSILLYIESITNARKFLSAARAAARNKPVIVIKAGREEAGARAAASHTGALAGSDIVFDAAIRRAGMLRVLRTDELFDAVETLARVHPPHGDRLAILTNGGGPGVMTADELVGGGGRLAVLSPRTIERLDDVLPSTWSRANPVDIIGDAPGERYGKALEILLEDEGIDACLILHVPTALASGVDAARAVLGKLAGKRRTVLTSWLGGETAREARRLLGESGIATYETPEEAVRAFLHMVRYVENQRSLRETPPSIPEGFTPDLERAREILKQVIAEEREILSEPEAKELLAAYGVPVVATRIAESEEEAARVAREIGFPVALKIVSPELTHKSDVGGVALDLSSAEGVQATAAGMRERLAKEYPHARLLGFSVQPMIRRPRAHELIIGASVDPIFGPTLLFGHGGTSVEVVADRAVALPPLNLVLARELVNRTRVSKLLRGYRDRPAADFEAICMSLIRISQLIIDLPEVQELDINPLLADEHGVLALDARARVVAAPGGARRLAIRPYPRELEEWVELHSGERILLRPIRPEDEPQHQEFFERLSPEDIRFRFFNLVRTFPHSEMARFTQIDYDREMAFLGTRVDEHGHPETLGVVRSVEDPDNVHADFGIIVRSDLKGKGLGKILMKKMIEYCRSRGTREIVGQVLRDNHAMLALAKSLGFRSLSTDEEGVVEVRLELSR